MNEGGYDRQEEKYALTICDPKQWNKVMFIYLGTVSVLSLVPILIAVRQRDGQFPLNSLFFITTVFLMVFAVCPAVIILSPPSPAEIERLPWLAAIPLNDSAFRATAPLILVAFISI